MRGQLDRIEKLERVANVERTPDEPFHVHFIAPSDNGPLLVGAYGPLLCGGRDSVKPIHLDREPGESEEDFLARVDRVFDHIQRGGPPLPYVEY